MIIDAQDKVLGRVAAFAAKQSLLGEDVDVINCEKAVITGKKRSVINHYKRKSAMGVPKKGPFIHRLPDRLVRRTIRGMLPYKKPRGAEAFKKVMCHVGVPKDFEGKKSADVPKSDISKLTNLKYISVGEVCKELGGKVE